jgi:hypothetical protein
MTFEQLFEAELAGRGPNNACNPNLSGGGSLARPEMARAWFSFREKELATTRPPAFNYSYASWRSCQSLPSPLGTANETRNISPGTCRR